MLADPAGKLRGRLPPGRRQPGRRRRRAVVPRQPLRAHRQPGGRLQRDAVDDLQHLQRGVELPAEPAVDRAASGAARRRRRRRCCRWAAPTTTRSRTGSPAGCHAMTLMRDPRRRARARRSSRRDCVAAIALAACGGGGNPLGNPPTVEQPARQRRAEAVVRLLPDAASTRSSWRSCRSTRTASSRPTPAPARAATTTPTAPAAPSASCRTPQPVDVTDPANTPDVIRATDMYKNFYSAQGEVGARLADAEPPARPSRWCTACCTAAA